MTKLEVFENVVKILREDSSTCKDKGIGDAEKYKAMISEDMSELDFVVVMKRYIASFQVVSHLHFWSENLHLSPAVSVRRYGDSLFVTGIESESKLSLGDEIVAIDGRSIPEAEAHFSEFLAWEAPERQMWGQVLICATKMTIRKKDGSLEEMDIERVSKRFKANPYETKEVSENTYYMKFDDFAEEEQIHAFIYENDEAICKHKNLIVDVRHNAGGSDSAYIPMIKYCFPEGKSFFDEEYLTEIDNGQEINYTEHNVDMRLDMLKGVLTQELPEDIRNLVQQMVDELELNRGKGFCRGASDGFETEYKGTAEAPEKIVILSDCYCGSSGDSFVENMKLSSKVTVIGRNTMGILDYSNVIQEVFDQYVLIYPTSRKCALDHGIKMGGVGVPVDIHIPWNPEHITRDVDLEKALEFLGE